MEEDLGAYFALVDRLARQCTADSAAPQDLLESRISGNDKETLQAIYLRGVLSDSVEAMRVEGLLVTGLFRQLTGDSRVGAFLLCFEIGDRVQQLRFESRFARYQSDDPLFALSPQLFEHVRDDLELIYQTALGAIDDDGTVEIPGGFARLDPMLAPSIVQSVIEAFPAAEIALRLDPHKAWRTKPTPSLYEAVMVPAYPRWWRNLGLHRGQETGARYEIQPPSDPKDDIESYLEFYVHRLRRLETIAQRKEHNHLTMMLEELEQPSDSLLIGRCIHWDTEAPYSDSPANAKVEHVDLAINVYVGAQVNERLAAAMNVAEKVKTPLRTHLLRLEKVPLQILPLLVLMFFRSAILRRDLLSNQFGYAPLAVA